MRKAQLARKPTSKRGDNHGPDNAILERPVNPEPLEFNKSRSGSGFVQELPEPELRERLEARVESIEQPVEPRSSPRGRTRAVPTRPGERRSSNGAVAKAGGKVAELASKAKTPLLAGGAALAGIAGGVALKSRDQLRRPLNGLRSVSLPKSFKNVDLGKVDLDAVMDAARQVRSLGEQVGDVVDAAEKTRKKHK